MLYEFDITKKAYPVKMSQIDFRVKNPKNRNPNSIFIL